ncbi:MAG: hypothetical protein K2X77_04305 [Candidatus Obscuribacterales bacterium]|jgi:hypothetical protein|nr:hypothetical protein [Candidatus Obscuribacterales bacterium]
MMSRQQTPSNYKPLADANKPAANVWRDKLEAPQANNLSKLLERAGLVGKEQLCDAAEIAESLKKSIDQVLVTSFLNEKQADLCSAAMRYIDKGIVTEALAADGLMVANMKGIPFAEGLKYFGFGW